jgi:hypothetical protein
LPTTLPTTLEKNFPVHPRWTLQKKWREGYFLSVLYPPP